MSNPQPSRFRLFWRDLKTQKRVVAALMRREYVTRWGRRNLGFAWLFAEPLVFSFPVLAVWSVIRPPYEHGLPMIPFLWTGYMGILMFRHVTNISLFVVKSNAGLLYHRTVTPFDLFIGRCVMEALGNYGAIAFSFAVFYLMGVLQWPYDFGRFLAGYLFMGWWALSVALILAALSERNEVVMHIWQPIGYIYITVCGFFFMASWLPVKLRGIALAIDPPLHCYEMIRAGLYGNRVETFYDPLYLTYVLGSLTLIGLWLIRDVRKYLEL